MKPPSPTTERDMSGKVCLVTGANTGIGKSTAIALAERGAELVLACRTLSKAEPVAEEIRSRTGNDKVQVHQLDLANLAATRASAEAYLASNRPIDVLVNNAGLAGQKGLTSDGFELAFGTNHLGPFLFTLLLLDRIRESAAARIVIVSSENHRWAKRIDYALCREPTKSVSGLREYSVSKLANVLFANELARRLAEEDVNVYSLNPGRIASDIWKRIPWPFRNLFKLSMKSNEEGAMTSVMCATSTELSAHSGRYYNQCVEEEASTSARDLAMAQELWAKSCAYVGIEDPLPAA